MQALTRFTAYGTVALLAALHMGGIPSVAAGQGIPLGDVNATAGEQVVITATLKTGGGSVAGTQNDFAYATAENR